MVSVIIPTYNRANKIRKSIDSVLGQTYTDFELLIIDDGSSDDTKTVVESIPDPRVKYFYQENSGACAARNNGISKAQGEYIAFQDSDDEWFPEKLQKQVAVLDSHPEADIVCCKTHCTKSDGTTFESMVGVGEGIIPRNVGPFGISTQTLLVRRKVFEEYCFDVKVSRYQDLDFLLCANKKHAIYCISECLVNRYHEENSISNHPERIYEMACYFQEKHKDIIEDKTQRLSYFLANMLIENGRYDKKYGKKAFYKKAYEINHKPKMLVKLLLGFLHIKY